MRLILELSRRKLRTTLNIVGASCDRIIRIRDGRIIADERVTELSAAA